MSSGRAGTRRLRGRYEERGADDRAEDQRIEPGFGISLYKGALGAKKEVRHQQMPAMCASRAGSRHRLSEQGADAVRRSAVGVAGRARASAGGGDDASAQLASRQRPDQAQAAASGRRGAPLPVRRSPIASEQLSRFGRRRGGARWPAGEVVARAPVAAHRYGPREAAHGAAATSTSGSVRDAQHGADAPTVSASDATEAGVIDGAARTRLDGLRASSRKARTVGAADTDTPNPTNREAFF